MSASEPTTVVTLRVPADLDRRIAQRARRARTSKSALLREALLQAFSDSPAADDPAGEARRQSLRVSRRASERDANDFVARAADTRGWR